jgi:hypothetical protein
MMSDEPQGVPLPVTPISPGDLTVIADMMRGHLAFVRLAFRASPQRDAYMQYIEHLRQRLAGQYRDNTPLPLTLQDIETIEAAMSTFEVMATHMAPPTKARDATIAACACLRQRIARMRSGPPSRRYLN